MMYATLCCPVLYQAYLVVLSYAIVGSATLCYAMLCYATLRYATLHSNSHVVTSTVFPLWQKQWAVLNRLGWDLCSATFCPSKTCSSTLRLVRFLRKRLCIRWCLFKVHLAQ